MKGFVINLDHRPDRMKLFEENKFPFEVERVSGIQFPDKNGERGCAASHIKTLSIHRKELPFVVFEDDCLMIEPWSTVEKAIKQLPVDWGALWLGATLRSPLKKYSSNLYWLKDALTSHAIIYNSERMVDYILKNYSVQYGKAIDGFYKRYVLEKFNCFITFPLCATQRDGVYSDIGKLNQDFHTVIKESYYKHIKG